MTPRIGCGVAKWEGADECSVCLECKAWLLVRELLLRTTLTVVAGLLRDHKFVATIRATLHWLAPKCASLDGSDHPLDQTDSPRTKFDDSSPSTLGASPTEVTQASRKRKRDAQSVSDVPQNYKDVARLYTSICCNLIQLQDITSDKSRGYAVEHIRAALRSTSEETAVILGSSLAIVDYLIRNEENVSTTNTSSTDASTMDTPMTKYDDAWILPFVQYWRSQTSSFGEDSNSKTCVSFFSSSLDL